MTTVSLWIALAAPAHAAPPPPEIVRALDLIDATPAQRRALQEVATAAMKDLVTAGARRKALELVEDTAAALLSKDVDGAALEATRRNAVGLLDRTSSTLLPHVVEAAEILTPAQRSAIADRVWTEAERWLGATGT